MNRVIIYPHEVDQDCFILKEKAKVEHLTNHLKVSIGKNLKVTCLDQGLCESEVVEIAENQIVLRKISELTLGNPRYIELFIAASRPPSMKKIIAHSCGFPVASIHFYRAQLSEKSYLTSKVLLEESLKKNLDLGLAQAGNYHSMPEIKHSNESLIKILDGQNFYFLQGGQSKTFMDYRLSKKLNLVIGPERGFSNTELDWLKQKGKGVSLSKGIQRVEIAAFAASAQIEMLMTQNKECLKT